MNSLSESEMQLLAGYTIVTPILAITIALLMSFALLRYYRRAVVKSMDAATGPETTTPAPPGNDTSLREARTATEPVVSDRDPATTLGASVETLYSQSLAAPWRAAAV